MDIVVLCGGLSAERDVSIASGTMAAAALNRCGHRVVLADLFFGYTEDYENPKEIFEREYDFTTAQVSEDVPDLDALRREKPDGSRIGRNIPEICRAADIVFMALHGEDGEDGKIQALFDLMGIKYTGTGPLGSQLAMNKSVAKQLFVQNNINTPRDVLLRRRVEPYGSIGFPCVVKPCSGGSSVGTHIVTQQDDYDAAVADAFKYDEYVLSEQYIKGRELTVGVIAGKAMPVGEICPKSGFFDYKNKYQSGLTEEVFPADIPTALTQTLQNMAEQVYDILKFDVYGRMDFIVDEHGKAWCMEGNTLPGLTPTSLLPKAAAAAGISYDELCEIIVRESLKKYEASI